MQATRVRALKKAHIVCDENNSDARSEYSARVRRGVRALRWARAIGDEFKRLNSNKNNRRRIQPPVELSLRITLATTSTG
jgi:hypothetical protein